MDTFSDGHGNKSLAAYIEAKKKEDSGVIDKKVLGQMAQEK